MAPGSQHRLSISLRRIFEATHGTAPKHAASIGCNPARWIPLGRDHCWSFMVLAGRPPTLASQQASVGAYSLVARSPTSSPGLMEHGMEP